MTARKCGASSPLRSLNREVFLVAAHHGDQNFVRQRQKSGIEIAENHAGVFIQIGDQLQQPGILVRSQALSATSERGKFRFNFLSAHFGPANHEVLLELRFVIARSRDRDLRLAEKPVAIGPISRRAHPAKENGTTLPSSSATIQRIGRMNRGLCAPVQIIDAARKFRESLREEFLQGFPTAMLPRTSCFATTYSPFGVFTIVSFETGMPCFSAKLNAARVGWPAASNATDFGGPMISRVTSSCFS